MDLPVKHPTPEHINLNPGADLGIRDGGGSEIFKLTNKKYLGGAGS